MAGSSTDRRIAERYHLTEALGRGGMGVVWRGEDTLLGRAVAVKEVELPATLDGEAREMAKGRVLREARAAARLAHPAAVTVYDVVEDEGRTFIVMELVDAPTLDDLVRRDGPLPVARVARIGLDLIDVLETAHAAGIVHRDIKPANVMVPAVGPVKLADFGVASLAGDPALTSSGMVLGSPAYMAPEQARTGGSNPASDLWSLGATLWLAVEGRSPFDRGTAIPTLTAVVHDEPEPSGRAGALGPVLLRLLSKDPATRPSTGEARAAFAAAAATSAAPHTIAGGTVVQRDHTPAPEPPRERRSPVLPIVLVALVALVAGGLALVAGRDDGDRTETAEPTAASTTTPPSTSPPTTAAAPAVSAAPRRTTPTTAAAPAAQVANSSPAAGTVPYTDEATGFRIDYPAGWRIERAGATRTDFRDPATGSYLRVEWTDRPGPSAERAWRELAPRFAASHEAYEEIRIETVDYRGLDAAEWEFLYTERGARLHAIDLGMVSGRYGFALNFQTAASRWAASQPIFESMKASFRPPS